MAAAIPLATLAVTAIGTGASIYQADRQSDRAEEAADAQKNEQAKLRSELAEKQRIERESQSVKEAAERQRRAGIGLGRRRNMRTGPLGLPDMGYYRGASTVSLGGGRASA